MSSCAFCRFLLLCVSYSSFIFLFFFFLLFSVCTQCSNTIEPFIETIFHFFLFLRFSLFLTIEQQIYFLLSFSIYPSISNEVRQFWNSFYLSFFIFQKTFLCFLIFKIVFYCENHNYFFLILQMCFLFKNVSGTDVLYVNSNFQADCSLSESLLKQQHMQSFNHIELNSNPLLHYQCLSSYPALQWSHCPHSLTQLLTHLSLSPSILSH